MSAAAWFGRYPPSLIALPGLIRSVSTTPVPLVVSISTEFGLAEPHPVLAGRGVSLLYVCTLDCVRVYAYA